MFAKLTHSIFKKKIVLTKLPPQHSTKSPPAHHPHYNILLKTPQHLPKTIHITTPPSFKQKPTNHPKPPYTPPTPTPPIIPLSTPLQPPNTLHPSANTPTPLTHPTSTLIPQQNLTHLSNQPNTNPMPQLQYQDPKPIKPNPNLVTDFLPPTASTATLSTALLPVQQQKHHILPHTRTNTPLPLHTSTPPHPKQTITTPNSTAPGNTHTIPINPHNPKRHYTIEPIYKLPL
ncbi:unnamed protein product [Nezara viridula]|uniref:Uncharacterized protein n=1 Tax=Nezara viridula TaxID=85310 RepID=A0A9P0EBD6_NEZVI|nr:unnamed protein product [Nezara viridula]